MIVLKHIVSIARNDGRLPFNPFAGYINFPESVDRSYLTQKDIQTLIGRSDEEHKRKFTTEKARFQILKELLDKTKLVLAIE